MRGVKGGCLKDRCRMSLINWWEPHVETCEARAACKNIPWANVMCVRKELKKCRKPNETNFRWLSDSDNLLICSHLMKAHGRQRSQGMQEDSKSKECAALVNRNWIAFRQPASQWALCSMPRFRKIIWLAASDCQTDLVNVCRHKNQWRTLNTRTMTFRTSIGRRLASRLPMRCSEIHFAKIWKTSARPFYNTK